MPKKKKKKSKVRKKKSKVRKKTSKKVKRRSKARKKSSKKPKKRIKAKKENGNTPPEVVIKTKPEWVKSGLANKSKYQQKKAGIKGAPWDGVRNYQAAKNLKSMRKGDLCFFYHSNIGKEIVGIVKVIKESYIDKTDKTGRFVAVTVQFKSKFSKPITLESIKKNKDLSHLALIKQSRLSVMPVDYKSWKIINNMSKI